MRPKLGTGIKHRRQKEAPKADGEEDRTSELDDKHQQQASVTKSTEMDASPDTTPNSTVSNTTSIAEKSPTTPIHGVINGVDVVNAAIDALPYIDFEYNDPQMKKHVDDLVAVEMKRSPIPLSDYIAKIKLPDCDMPKSEFYKHELKRLQAGEPAQRMDMSRYKVDPTPVGALSHKSTAFASLSAPQKEENIRKWIAALHTAQAQLEHQTARLVNLELMKRFGGNAWKTHNEHLSALKQSIENSLAKSQKDINMVNRKRKADQLSAGETLVTLEYEWQQLIKKNGDIEEACVRLESECKRLRTDAQQRGIALPAALAGTTV